MASGKHADLVAFGRKGLADRVELMHGRRCPCCAKPMHNKKVRPGNKTPRDKKTIGHDAPTGWGGNPDVWVFICHGCNQEQGSRTFRSWAARLDHKGDERAEAVLALANEIFAWREARGVPELTGARQQLVEAEWSAGGQQLSDMQKTILLSMVPGQNLITASGGPKLTALRRLCMRGILRSVAYATYELTALGEKVLEKIDG